MYFVWKTIKGKRYLYWQRSYRVGRKVKTEGGSLGRSEPWELNATCGYEAWRIYEANIKADLAEKAAKGASETVSPEPNSSDGAGPKSP